MQLARSTTEDGSCLRFAIQSKRLGMLNTMTKEGKCLLLTWAGVWCLLAGDVLIAMRKQRPISGRISQKQLRMRRLDAFLGLAWAIGTTPLTKCGCVLLDMLLTVLSRRGMTPSNRADGMGVVLTLQSHAGLLSTPMYWTDVLSDHKVYGVNLTIACEEASNFYMAPTRSYLKPEGVSADVWRKTISRHWMQTSPIPATTTEEEWYSFNAAVEECLCSAATDHGCRRTERRRPKGTAPWTVCATDYTCRAANLSTFPARSTRKLLGLIREYRRQILLEKEDPALLRHIRRTWPECHRFSSWFQAEQHLQQQLDMMRAFLKKANMQQWRARMNKQGRAATKWLKAKPALIPRSILRADGSKTTCATDSLQELSAFWRRVWDRPISNDVHQSLQSQVGAPPEHGPATCDIFPSAAALLAKARQSADGAPGPDGWAGGEVEHWCIEMWEVLQLLLGSP